MSAHQSQEAEPPTRSRYHYHIIITLLWAHSKLIFDAPAVRGAKEK